MSEREIKELERRFWEAWNNGETTFIAEMDEICANDVVFHGWFGADYGLVDHKRHGNEFFKVFPDLHWTIDDMIFQGDKIAVRYTMTGTHRGEFRGSPPTNRRVTVWGADIHRFVGGKLTECWSRIDTIGFMQQMGLMPTPKK